jgi:hypothetical protein
MKNRAFRDGIKRPPSEVIFDSKVRVGLSASNLCDTLQNSETEEDLEEVVNSTEDNNVADTQEIHFTEQQQVQQPIHFCVLCA